MKKPGRKLEEYENQVDQTISTLCFRSSKFNNHALYEILLINSNRNMSKINMKWDQL